MTHETPKNLDEKIKQALQDDMHNVDDILTPEKGLFAMLHGAYNGRMRFWMIISILAALIVSALIVWTGYHFFTATTTMDLIFWGICMLALLAMQIALKLWTFMEINRHSISREIKRLELAVAQLNKD